MRDVSLSAQKFQDFPDEGAAPKRRASNFDPTAPRAPKQKRSALGRMFALPRMGVMVLVGIVGLAFIGVPMNALFFQDGRHPAPLFSTHLVPIEKPATATAPTPPTRPARIEAARVEVNPVTPESAPRAAPKAAVKTDPLAEILKSDAAPPVKAEKKREVASRDPISSLLGHGDASPAQAAGPDRNVLSAQRALQRLGYVVKPDGLMSPGMRKTIEKFERDNGLPVTGELNAKVAKTLATRAASQHQ